MDYLSTPTTVRFHDSQAFVRGLMGPIGSGKSTACCLEILFRAAQQAPGKDGVRRSRWAVVRNTYRELQDTTIKTWGQWCPIGMGRWQQSDLSHTLSMPLGDGTEVELQVLFRALDRPDDVKKLLSLELTGAWVNEAREVPRPVIDMLQGRVGRYPSKREGGASWYGLIMDTNPPDSDHWWYRLFEEQRPEDWVLFRQPGGRTEQAENLDNLPDGYYERVMSGKDPAWIRVYVDGQYGFITTGRPVFPEYSDSVHCSPSDLPWEKESPIYLGLDFGLTPAAVICQEINGQWRVLDELVSEDMGAASFAKILKQKLLRDYPGARTFIAGDPAGDQRAQTDEATPYQVLRANGIEAFPATTNDFLIRREAVAGLLSRLTITGQPAFLVSPRASVLRKGMAGGYQYRRVQVSGEERYRDAPDKGRFSHVCDALQYACLGAGHGGAVVGADNWGAPIKYPSNYGGVYA